MLPRSFLTLDRIFLKASVKLHPPGPFLSLRSLPFCVASQLLTMILPSSSAFFKVASLIPDAFLSVSGIILLLIDYLIRAKTKTIVFSLLFPASQVPSISKNGSQVDSLLVILIAVSLIPTPGPLPELFR